MRATWSLPEDVPIEHGAFQGRYALVNIPRKATVHVVINTIWVPDGTSIKGSIRELGKKKILKDFTGSVTECEFKQEVKLEELELLTGEIGLICEVEIDKFALPDPGAGRDQAVTQILAVRNEPFVLSI